MRLSIEGPSLVLRGAYTAGAEVRAGDSLVVVRDWVVVPGQGGDVSVGCAANSAPEGAPVAVVVAGLARTVAVQAVVAGEAVTHGSGPDRGRARPATAGTSHGVCAQNAAAGKPAWIHVPGPGQVG